MREIIRRTCLTSLTSLTPQKNNQLTRKKEPLHLRLCGVSFYKSLGH